MYFIQGSYENTIVVNRSRFIASAYRVNSIDEVESILANVKKTYYDATHNCYAYRLKENILKCSDDGEPAKTAGAPILEVLLKKDITNILVVVTRYFGGVLLGAGGLIRAYGNATVEVLKNVKLFVLKSQQKLRITLSYSQYQNFLNIKNFNVEKTSFLTEVTVEGSCDAFTTEEIKKIFYNSVIEDLGVLEIEVPFDI